jgi:hypothetical protein
LFGFLGPNGTGKTNVVEQRKTPKQLARQEYLQVRGWERLRTTSRARRPTPTELALATGRYPEQMPLES